MESPKFQRRVEDFVCSHCGETVKGNGYTDHCPHCLWSLHVDNLPGDRACTCGGPMEPVQIEFGEPSRLHYQCRTCGMQKKVRAATSDSFDAMLEIARAASANLTGR